jgi:hypothetical protein
MLFLRFAFSIFTILFSGWIIIKLIFHPKEKLPLGEIIILSFGIGTGFVGLAIFSLSFIVRFLNINYFLLVEALLFIFAFLKLKNNLFRREGPVRQQKINYTPLAILLASIIIWEIAYVLLDSLSLPFTAWDAWAQWGYRAKMLYIEKTFPFHPWAELPWFNASHLDSPVLIPFLEAYIYFFLKEVYEPLVRVFCSFYYIGIIALFYYHLRKQFNISFALGSCFCLATIPNFLRMASSGYMEVPLIFYITAGILYIWKYLKEKDNSFLLLGSLFMGLGTWVKREGLSIWAALFLSSVMICLLLRPNINKKRFLFVISFIPLLIYSPWFIFLNFLGLKAPYFKTPFQDLVNLAKERLPLILSTWSRNLSDIRQWNILWIVFILSAIWFLIKRSEKLKSFFLFIIIFQTVFDFIIFIMFPANLLGDIRVRILQCVDRLILDVAPIALFFICQQLGEKWKIVR